MSASINNSHGGGARPDHRAPVPVHWDVKAGGDTPYDHSHKLLQAVVDEQGKYLERIASMQDDLTPEGYDRQRRAFSTSTAASRVDEAQQVAHNRTAIAAGELERAYAASIAQPGTPQAESNAIRVTNRAERELARANEGEYTGTVRGSSPRRPMPRPAVCWLRNCRHLPASSRSSFARR